MRNSTRVAAMVTAAALLAAGCAGAVTPEPKASGLIVIRGVALREPAADPRPYGAADTAFGLDVLRAWCRKAPDANLVFSPSSLASGLGMAYLGARGGTARAMSRVLHLPAAGGPALAAGLQARSAALHGLDGPGVTVAGSDQVWADPTLPTLASYLNAVATAYGAGVERVPLLTHPDQAARQIDSAISAATRGHIPQLLAPGSLNGIGWVLTDALYLHAAWAAPFAPNLTGPGPFTTPGGRIVRASFMDGGEFRYSSADGWTAVRIPYRGGRLAMDALLPDSGGGGCPALSASALSVMSARLAAAGKTGSGGRAGRAHSGTGGPIGGTRPGNIGGTRPGNSSAMTGIKLPKVNLRSSIQMNDLLKGLGMGVAFDGSADFTGLSPDACCIAFVQHAATLQVAEKGTVASAATAIGITPTAARVPIPEIDFNRPYLLVVTDTSTGEPLFMARVTNPVAG